LAQAALGGEEEVFQGGNNSRSHAARHQSQDACMGSLLWWCNKHSSGQHIGIAIAIADNKQCLLCNIVLHVAYFMYGLQLGHPGWAVMAVLVPSTTLPVCSMLRTL
jgi:hypothetical protein